MSRPKGSKNKKTIEKEKMVAENKEAAESKNAGGVDEEKNIPAAEEEKNIPAVDEENGSELEENNSASEEKNWDNFEFENEDPPVASRMRSKSSEKKASVCKRCGEELIVAPCRVDTNMIAGRVSTHREHPRFVTICMKCATELSEVVDRWLGDYPTKWEDHSDGY